MSFTRDTSFVTASFYPASFYPSFAEAAALHIPATQLSQSDTPNGSRLFKRSPSIAEGDALYCCHVHNCNHRGDIHDYPGISGFVAHLMVGNMYRICCFNVCRGVCLLCCLKRNHRTAVTSGFTGDNL